MTREDFEKPGPLLTDPEYGREPNLRNLILKYYHSHFPDGAVAVELTDKYIDGWIEENSPKPWKL